MDKYSDKILNKLLDKYEESKSFIGANKVSQNFTIYPEKLFPKYKDDSDYDTFANINEAVETLERLDYITSAKLKNGIIKRITLNSQSISNIYHALGRKPKKEDHEWLLELFEKYLKKDSRILKRYIKVQMEKIRTNKNIEYYDGNHSDYRDIFKAIIFAEGNADELFIRDASIRLFGDSKHLEVISKKVQSLMYQYGDYEEKDTVLEECGIVRTPTYVFIKGKAIISIAGQTIDLSKINGDIALSTKTINELDYQHVLGTRIITIENLTSFHDYKVKDDFCIYLGGFHNQIKRKFIMEINEQNEDKEYYHFGDIDAGGYYIYEHLIEKTKIPFKTLNMGIETLQKHKDMWKKLTANDKVRLKKLQVHLVEKEKAGREFEDYRSVIQYMLENDCKLEQEVLSMD